MIMFVIELPQVIMFVSELPQVIMFISELPQVGGFLWVLRFPPPINLTVMI
jgi:hypothetical protein